MGASSFKFSKRFKCILSNKNDFSKTQKFLKEIFDALKNSIKIISFKFENHKACNLQQKAEIHCITIQKK